MSAEIRTIREENNGNGDGDSLAIREVTIENVNLFRRALK
jgi:hypothetical protein